MPESRTAVQPARTALPTAHFLKAPASVPMGDMYNRKESLKVESPVKLTCSPSLVPPYARNLPNASNRMTSGPKCARCLRKPYREFEQPLDTCNTLPMPPPSTLSTKGTSDTAEVPFGRAWKPRSVHSEEQDNLSGCFDTGNTGKTQEVYPNVHGDGKSKKGVFISHPQLPTAQNISANDFGCKKEINSEIPKGSCPDLQDDSANMEKTEVILEEDCTKGLARLEDEPAQSSDIAGLSVRKHVLDTSDLRDMFPSTGMQIQSWESDEESKLESWKKVDAPKAQGISDSSSPFENVNQCDWSETCYKSSDNRVDREGKHETRASGSIDRDSGTDSSETSPESDSEDLEAGLESNSTEGSDSDTETDVEDSIVRYSPGTPERKKKTPFKSLVPADSPVENEESVHQEIPVQKERFSSEDFKRLQKERLLEIMADGKCKSDACTSCKPFWRKVEMDPKIQELIHKEKSEELLEIVRSLAVSKKNGVTDDYGPSDVKLMDKLDKPFTSNPSEAWLRDGSTEENDVFGKISEKNEEGEEEEKSKKNSSGGNKDRTIPSQVSRRKTTTSSGGKDRSELFEGNLGYSKVRKLVKLDVETSLQGVLLSPSGNESSSADEDNGESKDSLVEETKECGENRPTPASLSKDSGKSRKLRGGVYVENGKYLTFYNSKTGKVTRKFYVLDGDDVVGRDVASKKDVGQVGESADGIEFVESGKGAKKQKSSGGLKDDEKCSDENVCYMDLQNEVHGIGKGSRFVSLFSRMVHEARLKREKRKCSNPLSESEKKILRDAMPKESMLYKRLFRDADVGSEGNDADNAYWAVNDQLLSGPSDALGKDKETIHCENKTKSDINVVQEVSEGHKRNLPVEDGCAEGKSSGASSSFLNEDKPTHKENLTKPECVNMNEPLRDNWKISGNMIKAEWNCRGKQKDAKWFSKREYMPSGIESQGKSGRQLYGAVGMKTDLYDHFPARTSMRMRPQRGDMHAKVSMMPVKANLGSAVRRFSVAENIKAHELIEVIADQLGVLEKRIEVFYEDIEGDLVPVHDEFVVGDMKTEMKRKGTGTARFFCELRRR